VIEPFPLPSGNQHLTAIDFQRFSRAFTDIVLRKIPTANDVKFIFNENQLKTSVRNESVNELVSLFSAVYKSVSECRIYHDFLMIPFSLLDETVAVALLSKLDPQFTQRVQDGWLHDVRLEIGGEFLLLKQARVDEQTGFLNLSNLYSLLGNPSAGKPVQLTLVEISSRKLSYRMIANHLYRCGLILQNFIPDGAIIHHLGNGMFAIVFELYDGKTYSQFASSLVTILKREGFFRVHIGTSCSNSGSFEDMHVMHARQLLDEAWTALRVAAKRGPFGFCDYGLLAYPENHALVRPEQNLILRLRGLWRNSDQFSIVHFRSDNANYPAAEIVGPLLGMEPALPSGDDLIVYLDRSEGHAALEWTKNVVLQCKDLDSRKSVSAGVACFPFSDFKKSTTPYNCRKALSHAAFFGKSGVALFDAVSLNITGDIYFSDGDFVKAVTEYKRGLKCDEGNVNLYNSLGVTFTMMNKSSSAKTCFEKALDLNENSFMALYNIGLGELNDDRKEEAASYFKRALGCVFGDDSDDQTLKSDLRRHIGILASETGDYQLALDYLVPWRESCVSDRQSETVTFNIGRSYYGLNQNRQAVKWLQRALQNDEFDDRAMHLLGKVYHEEGEGDEIALSLCQKSVELDPNNLLYRLELAHIQIHFGMISEARINLKPCLKNQNLRAEAQLFLVQCCLDMGHHKRALNWFKKVGGENKKRFKLYNNIRQHLKTKGILKDY
jgi:tetratricopeptide (TPR) repeat protein